MLLRNKAKTWYRLGGLNLSPGATVEVTEHQGLELLTELPWHFEKVEAKKPPKPGDVVPPPGPPIFVPHEGAEGAGEAPKSGESRDKDPEPHKPRHRRGREG